MAKTRVQVQKEFRESGISIAAWAARNGFNANLVYGVLRGERPAVRGQAFEIAVKLGLKTCDAQARARLAA